MTGNVELSKFWIQKDLAPVEASRENIDAIYYHEPLCEGDRHFVDVVFKDGSGQRIFDFAAVQFKNPVREGREING